MRPVFLFPSTWDPYFKIIHFSELNAFLITDKHILNLSSLVNLKNIKIIPLKSCTFGINLLNKNFPFEIPVPSFFIGLRKQLELIKPDLIVATDITNVLFWQAHFYARKNKIPLILYSELHHYPKKIYSRIMAHIFIFFLKLFPPKEILTFTEYGRVFYAKRFSKIPVTACPVGINEHQFKVGSKKVSFLEKKSVQNLKLCTIARMVPFKKYDLLLKAIQECSNVELTIVGTGILEKKIKKKIIQLGLESRVTIIKKIPHKDIPFFFSNQDAFVLASQNEAIGMTVLEAMACGLPTITSDSVGANIYVEEGKTGYIFKTNNVSSLITAIQKMCINVSKLKKRLRKQAFLFTEKRCGKYLKECIHNSIK